MAFTGLLGSADSRLGNVVLGMSPDTGPPPLDQSAQNTLSLTQVVGLVTTLERTISQSLSLTQVAVKSIPAVAMSTLSLTGVAVFEKFKTASGISTLLMSQTLSVEADHDRTVSQGLALNHSAVVNKTKVLSVSQTLTLTQVATGIRTKSARNDLSLSQTVAYNIAKVATNVLSMGQTVDRALTLARTVYHNFIPSQQLSVATTIRRTLSDTVVFTQLAVGHAVRAINQSLSFSQAIVVDKAKPIYQVLGFLHLPMLTRSTGQIVDSVLPLTNSLQLVKSRALSAVSAFGMNQFARANRRLSRTITQHLTLTQELVQEYHLKSLEQTLDLAQTVAVKKIATKTPVSHLLLTNTVIVSTTLKRGLIDTLVFKATFDKYTGIRDREHVSVPTVQVVKVKKIVVLQSDELVITLPAPEFNDSEAGTGKINIKRSMSGDRRIYTRDNVKSKLNYQFVIDRKKAIELRNFILNSNTKFLTMTNWKGEIWAVQMTNTPFSFGEDAAWLGSPGGNKSSITLEFSGVKLN